MFKFRKVGLYDKQTGELLEAISYDEMIAKYGDCPKGEVWEGNKEAYNDTFNQERN